MFHRLFNLSLLRSLSFPDMKGPFNVWKVKKRFNNTFTTALTSFTVSFIFSSLCVIEIIVKKAWLLSKTIRNCSKLSKTTKNHLKLPNSTSNYLKALKQKFVGTFTLWMLRRCFITSVLCFSMLLFFFSQCFVTTHEKVYWCKKISPTFKSGQIESIYLKELTGCVRSSRSLGKQHQYHHLPNLNYKTKTIFWKFE